MPETLAQKVTWLLQHVPDVESGQLCTAESVAARMQRMLPRIEATEGSILAICDGTDEHPARELVEGIAHTFGVSATFLMSDEARIQDLKAQLDLLEALKTMLQYARETGEQGPIRIGCIR